MTANEPVRLLLLCNSPDNGGGANLLFRVTAHLDRRRVRATLFLHKDGWQAAQQRRHGYADVVVDPDFMELDPLARLDVRDPRPFTRSLASTTWKSARAIGHIVRLVGERRFDVLGGFGAAPAALATLAGTLARRPVVWSAQRVYTDKWTPLPMVGFALLPAVRRIFAVSKAAAGPYRPVGRKVEVAYNGIDPGELDPARLRGTLRARLGIPAGVPLVGLAGRLIRIKGVDLFLRAAAELAPRFPEARFVVIGRREGDGYDADLDGIVRAAGLDGRVVWTGWVPEMRTEMLDLDVVAIPSRRDAAPLVAYEAMALGRPIVASRCPGLDEQLEDGVSGLYVPREDVGALARAIERLLGDPELRARLGSGARAAACRRFDIRRMVRRLEDTVVDLARNGW